MKFFLAATAFALASGPAAAQWSKRILTSEMDGKTTLVIWKASANTLRDQFNRKYQPDLVIRCSPEDVKLILWSDTMFESYDNNVALRLKFDDNPPESATAGESDNNKLALISWSEGLLPKLLGANTLRVEFTPFRGGPEVARFDVRGLKAHRPDLSKHCGI